MSTSGRGSVRAMARRVHRMAAQVRSNPAQVVVSVVVAALLAAATWLATQAGGAWLQSTRLETRTTCGLAGPRRSRTAKPSMSGSCTSSSTTSGWSRSIAWSASAPSSASPTTAKPSSSRSTRAQRRKLGWSSTMRIVGLLSMAVSCQTFLGCGVWQTAPAPGVPAGVEGKRRLACGGILARVPRLRIARRHRDRATRCEAVPGRAYSRACRRPSIAPTSGSSRIARVT